MAKITLEEALQATAALREERKGSRLLWLNIRRGQVLRFKHSYFGGKPGDLLLVEKDSANHGIYISDKPYQKFSGSKLNFEPAEDAEVKKLFGEGAKAEPEIAADPKPNTVSELSDLDNEVESENNEENQDSANDDEPENPIEKDDSSGSPKE